MCVLFSDSSQECLFNLIVIEALTRAGGRGVVELLNSFQNPYSHFYLHLLFPSLHQENTHKKQSKRIASYLFCFPLSVAVSFILFFLLFITFPASGAVFGCNDVAHFFAESMRTALPVKPQRVPRTATTHHRDFPSDAVAHESRPRLSARAQRRQQQQQQRECSRPSIEETNIEAEADSSREEGKAKAQTHTSPLSLLQPPRTPAPAGTRGSAVARHGDTPQHVASRVGRLRQLLRQVELPSLDTAVIESQLQVLLMATPTTALAGDAAGRAPNGIASRHGQEEKDAAQRCSLADVPLNRHTTTKSSTDVDTHLRPSSSSSLIESPLLSLRMLKGSKHAYYYLPGNEASGERPAASADQPASTESSDTRVSAAEREKKRENSESFTPPPTHVAASLGAPLGARLAADALLLHTEEVLLAYRSALASALRAVQHREAVWTALQQFLHVVRRDGAPASATTPRDVVPQRGGGGRGVALSSTSTSSDSFASLSARGEGAAAPTALQTQKPLRNAASTPAEEKMEDEEKGVVSGGNGSSHVVPPLRSALRLSLEHILAPQPSPPSSSSAGLTSPVPPATHTPRPPLLTPSSAGGGRRGAAAVARPRAQSAATPTAAAVVVAGVAGAGVVPPPIHRRSVPAFHPSSAQPPLLSANQKGALPAVAAMHPARVSLRRTPSVTAAARSRSAPREAPVAPLLSPRPPSGRVASLTPRARILSRVEGGAALQAATPPAPWQRTASTHTGVVSLESRVHAVPRLVYAACLGHYLFYLQHTTLAVLEAVAALRRDHLHHPAPFIVEHRNYLLEVLTQTASLAGDATVQWLMHDGDDGRSALTPLRASRSSSPLRSARSQNEGSPVQAEVRRSLSNPTQEAEQAEESAAHRALQVAAVQGRWPEQLLRHPLLSTHASLASFSATPALLRCVAAARGEDDGEEKGKGERVAWATAAAASASVATVRASAASLLRVPKEVRRLYGSGAETDATVIDTSTSLEGLGCCEAAGAGARRTASSLSSSPTAAQRAVDEVLQRRSRGSRPSSAMAGATPVHPLPHRLRARLEEGERILHQEVAVALAYVKWRMQCALRCEYPLYLRGFVQLQEMCVDAPRRVSRRASAGACAGQPVAPSSSSASVGQRASSGGGSRPAKKSEARRTTDRGGADSCCRGTVPFFDEELRASWMEELKVSWQLLMSGSSCVE